MGVRIIAVALLLAALAGVWSLRGRAMDQYLETQAYEDIYYLPPPSWLQVMSLGYRRALADLIWLRALIYFGDEFENRGAVKHVFNYGESMLALDPDFRRVYRWVGVAAVYTPTGSPTEFIERAIDVLRRGVARFPDDGQLAWDAGATIMYELLPHLPKDDPDRERLRTEGNEHMMAAARLGAGPDWLVITNATALRKLGEKERELRHLEEMYALVRDPAVKAQIRIRLSQLQDEAYAEAFRRVNEEFEQRRKDEFPYVPSTLYFFVADPVEGALGLEDES
jgi:tetratricopeptide (TPR) repeat protein